MAAVRWCDTTHGNNIEIFADADNYELIFGNDPRFAKLLAALEWIPPTDEIRDESEISVIKWWDDIPIEMISHLVKKT